MRSSWIATSALAATVLIAGCQSNPSTATNTTKTAAAAAKCSEDCAVADKELAAIEAAPSGATVQPAKVWTYGGESTIPAAGAVSADKVIADPAAYADKRLRITGTVVDVCAKKGCWLRVAPAGSTKGSTDLFIKFADPPTGRLVPLESVGHDVTVEGTLKQGMLSERAARHFKEDAGAPKEEIEKIVGPQKQLVVAGAVVTIDGVEPRTATQ